MRADAPGRLRRTSGKFPVLATHAQREAALAAVRVGRYAASARVGVKSHRKLVRQALAQWRMPRLWKRHASWGCPRCLRTAPKRSLVTPFA